MNFLLLHQLNYHGFIIIMALVNIILSILQEMNIQMMNINHRDDNLEKLVGAEHLQLR